LPGLTGFYLMAGEPAAKQQTEADTESKEEKKITKKIKVGYWNIRGLGAGLRMMVMYAAQVSEKVLGTPNVTLEALTYDVKETSPGVFDRSAWLQVKPEHKLRNPLANLPWVQIDDGPEVVQSNACFAHLGRSLGLWGQTEAEISQCEQLLCEVYDLRNNMTGWAYGYATKESAKQLMKRVEGQFDKLELCASSAHPFFVAGHATAPDFHIWEMMDQYHTACTFFELPDILESYPKLRGFYNGFRALPANQKYLSSPLYKLPFNNPSAGFGSAPGGGRFQGKS